MKITIGRKMRNINMQITKRKTKVPWMRCKCRNRRRRKRRRRRGVRQTNGCVMYQAATKEEVILGRCR